MSDLSLFGIESELHQLYDEWQTAETPEALQSAEAAIIDYGQREVRKVDGIRSYLRVCDEQEKAAKAEAQNQTARAGRWKARADHLKHFVMEVMRSFGKTKLEGNTGVLRIQANGGKQPLTITDESLVPDELCVWAGEIDGPAWGVICRSLDVKVLAQILPHCRVVRKPDNDAVRARLARGEAVAGARLDGRGEHLRVG